jgi:hypothetical protein
MVVVGDTSRGGHDLYMWVMWGCRASYDTGWGRGLACLVYEVLRVWVWGSTK